VIKLLESGVRIIKNRKNNIFPKNVGVIRASQFIEHIQYTFRWIWFWRGWL